MKKLHIANTFFEWELETDPQCSLSEAFAQNPIFRQLQFLPVLYSTPGDGLLVSEPPPSEYWNSLKNPPQSFTLSDSSFLPFEEIESWGASRLISAFADAHQLRYSIPNWDLVRQVNSKQFSFFCSPKLPGGSLLETETEAKRWLSEVKGKKVLKTCYGVSGTGHLIIDDPLPWERIHSFLRKEWNKELPVIAEPWVERILDFSTQWTIDQSAQISYLGATLCNNNERGQYQFSTVGKEEVLFPSFLPLVKEHCAIVEPILAKIAQLGFFGNVGIDALLYTLPEDPEIPLLHPIVEINARKTMGWVALNFQKKHFPEETVRFTYAPAKQGYLPQAVLTKTGKWVTFTRNLY